MSDHVLRISAGPGGALLLTVMLAACSDEGKPASEALPPAPPVEMEALTDAELMGIPRDRLILTLPWSEVPVSRDPAPNSARATLRSVDVSGGERFDRAIFVSGPMRPFLDTVSSGMTRPRRSAVKRMLLTSALSPCC